MFLNHMLKNRAGYEQLAKKLKQLELNMSTGRKLFRLGNMIHAVETARKTYQLSDPVLRFCLTVSSLTRVAYFVCDNILWARSIGFLSSIDKERWSLRASKYYFASLLITLVRDLYEVVQQMDQKRQDPKQQKVNRHREQNHPQESRNREHIMEVNFLLSFMLILHILKSNPPLLMDLVKNLCDLFGPLDRLSVYKTSPAVVGLCGFISSSLGILTVAQPVLRLKP
ncbi:peroxisomal membrane protein 11A isoform X2 [Protopterus annectens]|nr:peroxisomal membrane protein 11A isoform X2 [Protopterus annectens]